MVVGPPDAGSQHPQGERLHEGVHRDAEVRLVLVKGLADLGPDPGSRGSLDGHMHNARLLEVVAQAPQEAVLHEEAVAFGQLVEGPLCVVCPEVHNVNLQIAAAFGLSSGTTDSSKLPSRTSTGPVTPGHAFPFIAVIMPGTGRNAKVFSSTKT